MEAKLDLTALMLAQGAKRYYDERLEAGHTETELGTMWQRELAQTYATLALAKAIRELAAKFDD